MFDILIMGAVYAAADRFSGGGWPALDARLPGRALFWATGLCALAGLVVIGVPGVILALGWGGYRSLKNDIFGASINPTKAQIAPTFAHHALAVFGAMVAGIIGSGASIFPILATVAYAAVATALACWYSKEVESGRPQSNTYVELARGFAFGLIMSLVI